MEIVPSYHPGGHVRTGANVGGPVASRGRLEMASRRLPGEIAILTPMCPATMLNHVEKLELGLTKCRSVRKLALFAWRGDALADSRVMGVRRRIPLHGLW